MSYSVLNTCWASQKFLSTVSGHFVHRAEEWSNYESPVHKQRNRWVSFSLFNTSQTIQHRGKLYHRDTLTCWVLLLRCPGCSLCSTWIRMYSWLVRSIIPPVKGPPTWSFSKALSRKSVRFIAVGCGLSREDCRYVDSRGDHFLELSFWKWLNTSQE